MSDIDIEALRRRVDVLEKALQDAASVFYEFAWRGNTDYSQLKRTQIESMARDSLQAVQKALGAKIEGDK